MIAAIAERREDLAALCRRFDVTRLEVFGSAARRAHFDDATSDVDFLVELRPRTDELVRLLDLREALEGLLGRRVDLVERRVVEASRNYIRRRHILSGAEAVYTA